MITPPYVIKEIVGNQNHSSTSVLSELLEQRIIYFAEDVNEETAATLCCLLMYLHAKDKKKPITIYIDSPGGSVYSGNSIIDTMDLIKADGGIIKTVCFGLCASYGAVILCNGSRGYRSALKRSTIMIHQVLTGVGKRVQATDISIVAEESNRLKKMLAQVISDNTGKPYDKVVEDCERDHWLAAEDCLPGAYGKYGLIDKIETKLK